MLIADVIPPVFLSCPSDIRASINLNSTATANWKIPVAKDNSNEDLKVTVSPQGVTPPYSFHKNTVIVYTASDTSGNTRNCSFRVLLEGWYKVTAILFCFVFFFVTNYSKSEHGPEMKAIVGKHVPQKVRSGVFIASCKCEQAQKLKGLLPQLLFKLI